MFNKNRLRINNATSDQNGVYACSARNDAGYVNSDVDFLLNVRGENVCFWICKLQCLSVAPKGKNLPATRVRNNQLENPSRWMGIVVGLGCWSARTKQLRLHFSNQTTQLFRGSKCRNIVTWTDRYSNVNSIDISFYDVHFSTNVPAPSADSFPLNRSNYRLLEVNERRKFIYRHSSPQLALDNKGLSWYSLPRIILNSVMTEEHCVIYMDGEAEIDGWIFCMMAKQTVTLSATGACLGSCQTL